MFLVLKHQKECKKVLDLRKESLVVKIWNMIWPLFIYGVAQNVVAIFGSLIIRNEDYAIVFLIVAALLCIPIYYRMYRKDQATAEEEIVRLPMGNKDFAAIILSGAALALALNNLIALTPLPMIFTRYEETNEVLYNGGMFLQIIGAGIIGCVVEELSMRGVSYLRTKRYYGKKRAIFINALIFGLYHLNVVQAVYAFFLGLFFAWVFERYQTLWAPVIAHMSANLFIILLSECKFFNHMLTTMVGFCLITCICVMVFFYGWRFMNMTDPVVELEFVEKEPDTLKKLTAEYKEQEREEES